MKICILAGCINAAPRSPMCTSHAHRKARYGTPWVKSKKGTPRSGTCEVDGCDSKIEARGVCNLHYKRLMKFGDPLAGIARSKGEGSTYSVVHKSVVKTRGPALDFMCPCGQPALEWAYDHADTVERCESAHGGEYSDNVHHYIPLCRSCHRQFDFAAKAIRRRAKGEYGELTKLLEMLELRLSKPEERIEQEME